MRQLTTVKPPLYGVRYDFKETTGSRIITVSVDEKPGVQAIKNIAPDLPPLPGKCPQVLR
ncbi:MAG: putative transposase, partial [Candidatus Scalindua rubra]